MTSDFTINLGGNQEVKVTNHHEPLDWNIKEEIIRQMADVRSWGGRFVTLTPKVQVIEWTGYGSS